MGWIDREGVTAGERGQRSPAADFSDTHTRQATCQRTACMFSTKTLKHSVPDATRDATSAGVTQPAERVSPGLDIAQHGGLTPSGSLSFCEITP